MASAAVEGYLKDTNGMRQQGKGGSGAVWCPISDLYDGGAGGVTPHTAPCSPSTFNLMYQLCAEDNGGGVLLISSLFGQLWVVGGVGVGGGFADPAQCTVQLCLTPQNQSLLTSTSFFSPEKAMQHRVHTRCVCVCVYITVDSVCVCVCASGVSSCVFKNCSPQNAFSNFTYDGHLFHDDPTACWLMDESLLDAYIMSIHHFSCPHTHTHSHLQAGRVALHQHFHLSMNFLSQNEPRSSESVRHMWHSALTARLRTINDFPKEAF